MSFVIVIGGLPGTGKSTIAKELTRTTGFTLLSKDVIEAAVVTSGVCRIEQLNGVGYHLMKSLVQEQLTNHQPVILDFIASKQRVAEFWPELQLLPRLVFECVCDDVTMHRQRIESRVRAIPGWYELDWSQVEQIQEVYEPMQAQRQVLNSCIPVAENVKTIINCIQKK